MCTTVGMHIHIIPNRASSPAVLLRESYRQGNQVRKRTLANLSALPMDQVESIRRILKGERLVSTDALFEISDSSHHGHVQAVRLAMKRLGFDTLIASRPCRERDLVVAMVAARILQPHTKLATTRWWHTTTLAEDLHVADADEDALYQAMDWLLERQGRIERKLAARHLDEDSLVLYDLTSSYFEGTCCPLAALGHNRDGKKGTLQVNYGLLTNGGGCPVSVSAYRGNTGDPKTVAPQIRKVKDEFGIKNMVLVGDRGMIGQKLIDQLREHESIDWITALKTGQIRALVDQGAIQMSFFDERNLIELTHGDYPGERLMVCRNPLMGERRARTRQSLLKATVDELTKVQRMVARGKLKGEGEIGVRVGRVVNKYKVAKLFTLQITDKSFSFDPIEANITAESALDGLYVIRTSLPQERLDAADTVRSYKLLSNVERAFRCFKTIDLKVRPIHHHLENRVRSHIFLCMLAYYVEWHMLAAWREMLFSDEDQQAKQSRDPVAPAKRSDKAMQKVHTHRLDDGTEAESFRTLLENLGTIVRNVCRRKQAPKGEASFTITTTPNERQQRALDLIQRIPV